MLIKFNLKSVSNFEYRPSILHYYNKSTLGSPAIDSVQRYIKTFLILFFNHLCSSAAIQIFSLRLLWLLDDTSNKFGHLFSVVSLCSTVNTDKETVLVSGCFKIM